MTSDPKASTPDDGEPETPAGPPVGPDQQSTESAGPTKMVVLGADGMPVTVPTDPQDAEERDLTDLVEQPAKVMRIGSMIKQLLEEVRDAPIDEAARDRLRQVYGKSISELEDGLAPELVEELRRLSLPFDEDTTPSDAELRVAQAQLVGWLEGLFHGIQTTLFAQQMAARAQLEQMRRRSISAPSESGADGNGRQQGHPPSGPYL